MALRPVGSTVFHILKSKRGEAHTAEQIAFQPPAGMAATTVQEAIQEIITILSNSSTIFGAAQFYHHIQAIPADVWTVNHGLGFRPAVTMFDINGTEIDGVVEHQNENALTISFIRSIAGEAQLS